MRNSWKWGRNSVLRIEQLLDFIPTMIKLRKFLPLVQSTPESLRQAEKLKFKGFQQIQQIFL